MNMNKVLGTKTWHNSAVERMYASAPTALQILEMPTLQLGV